LLSGEESKSNHPISRIQMNEDDNIYFENGLENDQDDDDSENDFNAEEGCVEDGES
jgi:hypothetical protein